jgi:predicted dinucleotide-binding enzyme
VDWTGGFRSHTPAALHPALGPRASCSAFASPAPARGVRLRPGPPPAGVTTAIVGVGNIGGALARHLVAGGESVVLAAKDGSRAEALADELGPLARAASVKDAVAGADAVVFALWLDTIKELIPQHAPLLEDKVVVDPSNPVAFDENGQMMRTLPERQSAGSVVAALLPAGAHYVKAFGTLGADALAKGAYREPRRAVLFYATDDDAAATTIERLIRVAGFDPLKAGGVADAGRIEAPGGDLHQFGLNGELVDLDQARAAIAAAEPPG